MAAGFEHYRTTSFEQPIHQRVHVFLQQRLAAGNLDERTTILPNRGDDLLDRHFAALVERIGGIAPGTSQIACREPHEHAGPTRPGRFALNGVEDFVDG